MVFRVTFFTFIFFFFVFSISHCSVIKANDSSSRIWRDDEHNHNNVFRCLFDALRCSELIADKLTQSLKNQHLVMIGDSLSRYQYISLTYTLRHRHPVSREMSPNPVEGHSWGNWGEFFKFSNGMLKPYEITCDCLHHYPDYEYDNRHYHDPILNITVSHLCYTNQAVIGRIAAENTFNPNVTGKYPSTIAEPPLWQLELTDLFTGYVDKMPIKPTIVVLNSGLWGGASQLLSTDDFIAKILLDAFNVVDTFIWRTTHHSRPSALKLGRNVKNADKIDSIFASFDMVHIQNTSWTSLLNESDYWDNMHMREPGYMVVNYQLCDVIKDALKSSRKRKQK